MRKLASIQLVENVRNIEGADAIQVCNIQGFEVVIKKGEFKNNDIVVYCETDSILPERPEFEFLRPRKFRIKIAKMRGQVSEGICFPLNILPAGDYKVGQDVTELLGVIKYDPQAEDEKPEQEKQKISLLDKKLMKFAWYRERKKRMKSPSGFPNFVHKTDETRIQSYKSILNSEETFEVTEKLEGQSATYALHRKKLTFLDRMMGKEEFEFYICSRSQRKGNDGSNWARIADSLDIRKTLMNLIQDDEDVIAIQGEIIGEGIQKNIYKIEGLDFYAYNIVIRKMDGSYRLFNSLREVGEVLRPFGIKITPVIDYIVVKGMEVKDLVEMSKGNSALRKTKREGIVLRKLGKFGSLEKESFKVINPDYLLSSNE